MCMNIMLKSISLLKEGLTTPILANILRITKEDNLEKETLSNYLKTLNFIEIINKLKDISEVQLYLILFFKIINMNEIKIIKPFEELLKIEKKIITSPTLTHKLKDILFKLVKYTNIKGFECEKLELPNKIYNINKSNIYLFFNEKNMKFLIDKEVVTIAYSTIKNYKIGYKFIEFITITKKVKIYFKEYLKNKKSLVCLLKQYCEEISNNTVTKLSNSIINNISIPNEKKETIVFKDNNTDSGVSFKFISDFNTNTNFLNRLTNDFDKKSNHFFKRSNFLEEDKEGNKGERDNIVNSNTPNSSKLVDPSEIIDSESKRKLTPKKNRYNNIKKEAYSVKSSSSSSSFNEKENKKLINLNKIFNKQIEREKKFIFQLANNEFKIKKEKYEKLKDEIEKYSNKIIN